MKAEVNVECSEYQEQATAAMPRDKKSLTVGNWGVVRAAGW